MRLIGLMAIALVAGCNSAPSEIDEGGEANTDDGNLWVTSQYLDRHTCASESCGIVGRLFFREAATVLETEGEWARITKPYDASCLNGVSEYVDKGDSSCTADNGIADGKFAEWVLAKDLSATRPADPAETAAESERVVAQSDDFAQHREAFVKAANQLIEDGRCTAAEIGEMGGWVKSTNERDRPIYFTYCGGMTMANRLYLNVDFGRDLPISAPNPMRERMG